MFGQCLLMGTGISVLSTSIYGIITDDKYERRDRKNEYITIFAIILIVSTILMLFFNNNSNSLISTRDLEGAQINNTKPPF